ncbi:MAG: hypothetical protein LBD22_03345 [Spirochaetaceae bacterium]|jgi:hypothetical protein|nr:hypothetical protein [Spirochaetaceae bacterium]
MTDAAIYPLVIETQTPACIEDAVVREKMLSEALNSITMLRLYGFPFPQNTIKRKIPALKAQYISRLSKFLAFKTQQDFEAWLALLPPVSQKILYDTVMEQFCVICRHQNETEIPLTNQPASDYWNNILGKELQLLFLNIHSTNDLIITSIDNVFADAIKPWLVPPPEANLDNCVTSVDGTEIYNNSHEAANAWALLCEALPDEINKYEMIHSMKPFTKRNINVLRGKCGLKPFPLNEGQAPDSLDLAARFTVCMTSCELKRPHDEQLGIKQLVEDFFDKKSPLKKNINYFTLKWNYLESHVLSDHLKKQTLYYGKDEPPQSRGIFHAILLKTARDGRWFSADSLARHILITEKNFLFLSEAQESYCYIKASSITSGDITYESLWGDTEYQAAFQFRFDLILKPLFKAYCYLFAALGILEITQREAAAPVLYRGKYSPFSPYDSLDAVRVTDFGCWCLGLSDKRPQNAKEHYEAIADKTLLLVTVQGKSFERSLYLDSIGVRLGEDRWRISKCSFIAGCQTKTEIEARIKKFKKLIDAKPAAHWEAFFNNALNRAGFFNKCNVPATVYQLGNDRELIEELLNDSALSSCALRAEGQMLVVPDKHKKKFLKILAEHGIAHF